MVSIILSNFGFYFNLVIPVAIALFLFFTNREYIFKEFCIQSLATLLYIGAMYFFLFTTTTDLVDTEYWNGKATRFEYYEEWTELVTYEEEECTGSGKDRKCTTVEKTRREYHSPEWKMMTTNGEIIAINSSEFKHASTEFGYTKKDLYRSDQVSTGDGDMFYSVPSKIIPTSVKHTYDNFVIAAKQNVIHTRISKEEIAELVKSGKLKSYPSQYIGTYGEYKLNRVVDTVNVPNKTELLTTLDVISAQIGASKQANPILYITQGADRTFTTALESFWNKGKKNDIILVVNIDKNGIIEWTDVIAWTNNTDFIVDAQNVFKGDKLDVTFINKFAALVIKGYVRKPMAEFSYLKENITLEWYWQLIVFVGNVIISFFIFRYMLTNTERKGLRVWRRRIR